MLWITGEHVQHCANAMENNLNLANRRRGKVKGEGETYAGFVTVPYLHMQGPNLR